MSIDIIDVLTTFCKLIVYPSSVAVFILTLYAIIGFRGVNPNNRGGES